ncbi:MULTISPECIES: hypothetical protein [Halomonas]|uniref:hypothetical protein n=1 Tax=Halomonas TaxID=2745 RepID=UPI0020B7036A|nr:hypothetical protein [Halomonas sp. 3H]
MPKPFTAASAALLLNALLLLPAAHATTFNTDDAATHGHWQSLTLSLGEERHYRALEAHSYSDSLLSLNFTPGDCERPWLELRVELGERQPQSRVVNRVPADLRVDHETIHSGEAAFITQRGDGGFYVQFTLDERPLLVEEMRRGETLRLRMMRGEDDPWFMVFSLEGAAEAMDRARQRCRNDRG